MKKFKIKVVNLMTIKQLRESTGLSQSKFAKKIPYSYWNIVAFGTRCKKTARVRNVYDKYNINQGGN